MDELNKIKDYILKLAKEKGSIDYSDYSYDDVKIWKYLVLTEKDDGYIICVFLTCAIRLELSGKGVSRMPQGVYSAMQHKEAKMKASELIETVCTEVTKQGISILFKRLE